MIHELQIEHDRLERLETHRAVCDVRRHSRDFQAGDKVMYTCTSNYMHQHAVTSFWITHVATRAVRPGVHDGYCLLSLTARE